MLPFCQQLRLVLLLLLLLLLFSHHSYVQAACSVSVSLSSSQIALSHIYIYIYLGLRRQHIRRSRPSKAEIVDGRLMLEWAGQRGGLVVPHPQVAAIDTVRPNECAMRVMASHNWVDGIDTLIHFHRVRGGDGRRVRVGSIRVRQRRRRRRIDPRDKRARRTFVAQRQAHVKQRSILHTRVEGVAVFEEGIDELVFAR